MAVSFGVWQNPLQKKQKKKRQWDGRCGRACNIIPRKIKSTLDNDALTLRILCTSFGLYQIQVINKDSNFLRGDFILF